MDIRQQLRNTYREKRNSLSPEQQSQAADAVADLIVKQPQFLESKHLGFYMANDGELDPLPLMRRACELGKICYLPILRNIEYPHLYFVRYTFGDDLEINDYGIPEPRFEPSKTFNPSQLDLVFAPLITFDRQGNRLGMGVGYYDRSFAFKKQSNVQNPPLIGLAYGLQETESIPPEEWDIPINAVCTESAFIELGKNKS